MGSEHFHGDFSVFGMLGLNVPHGKNLFQNLSVDNHILCQKNPATCQLGLLFLHGKEHPLLFQSFLKFLQEAAVEKRL